MKYSTFHAILQQPHVLISLQDTNLEEIDVTEFITDADNGGDDSNDDESSDSDEEDVEYDGGDGTQHCVSRVHRIAKPKKTQAGNITISVDVVLRIRRIEAAHSPFMVNYSE